MVREGVKMANPSRDLALILMPTRLVHKVSAPMLYSTQFDAQPSPSVNRNHLHLVHIAGVGISLNKVLSGSIGVNSAERLDVKKAVAHTPPPEPPNRSATT